MAYHLHGQMPRAAYQLSNEVAALAEVDVNVDVNVDAECGGTGVATPFRRRQAHLPLTYTIQCN